MNTEFTKTRRLFNYRKRIIAGFFGLIVLFASIFVFQAYRRMLLIREILAADGYVRIAQNKDVQIDGGGNLVAADSGFRFSDDRDSTNVRDIGKGRSGPTTRITVFNALLSPVEAVHIYNAPGWNEIRQDIKGFSSLKELVFSGSHCSDADLGFICQMPQLVHLNIENAKITDGFLTCVGRLVLLQRLTLKDTAITDAGLLQLGALQSLRLLDLTNTFVTDDGISVCSKMPYLSRVLLGGTKVKGSVCFKFLEGLQNLIVVDLSHTAINDVEISLIESLRHVEVLDISGTDISDEGVEAICKMDAIRLVYMEDTRITENGRLRMTTRSPKIRVMESHEW